MVRLLVTLVANLFVLLFWPLVLRRRSRAAPNGAWLQVEIDGPITEIARKTPFWIRQKPIFALQSLRRAIELSARDPRVAGFVITIKRLRTGSATATALRNVVLDARRAGKRVAVYLPNGAGTRDLYVASAAEQLLLGPETFVTALGFAVESLYLRGVLDRAGVEPEVFARGRYKSAGESLTQHAMSEPHREQLEALLDVTWDVLLGALSEGRAVDRARAEYWVENGPWPAELAAREGLVDRVLYADEIAKLLDPAREDGAPLIPMKRYLRARQAGFRPLRSRPKVAVIEIKGPIVSEHVGVAPVAAEDEVCAALDRARETARYSAAVLHIDSPGGSALASDRMLHAIRRLAEKKPVVAYMGDSAASGGYMVAVGAHAIYAQPTTVTGSIGVVSARFIIEPILAKLGVGVEIVKRGSRADMLSATRRLTPGERAALDRELDAVYERFLNVVAEGRGRERSQIEPLAGGRVWSGRDALAHGLVDRLGGFQDALEDARMRAGADALAHEPELISAAHWRPRRGLIPRLLQQVAGSSEPWPAALTLPLLALGTLVTLARARDAAYLWCPYSEADLDG